MEKKNILEEAIELTSKDRRDQYGHPREDFDRTARIASILLGKELSAREVVLILLVMKLSRNAHKYKRDTLVDIAGYSRVLSILHGEEG